jgi:hypothetical protein
MNIHCHQRFGRRWILGGIFLEHSTETTTVPSASHILSHDGPSLVRILTITNTEVGEWIINYWESLRLKIPLMSYQIMNPPGIWSRVSRTPVVSGMAETIRVISKSWYPAHPWKLSNWIRQRNHCYVNSFKLVRITWWNRVLLLATANTAHCHKLQGVSHRSAKMVSILRPLYETVVCMHVISGNNILPLEIFSRNTCVGGSSQYRTIV